MQTSGIHGHEESTCGTSGASNYFRQTGGSSSLHETNFGLWPGGAHDCRPNSSEPLGCRSARCRENSVRRNSSLRVGCGEGRARTLGRRTHRTAAAAPSQPRAGEAQGAFCIYAGQKPSLVSPAQAAPGRLDRDHVRGESCPSGRHVNGDLSGVGPGGSRAAPKESRWGSVKAGRARAVSVFDDGR